MTASKTASKRGQGNGAKADGNGQLVEAIAYEDAIRVEAEAIWDEQDRANMQLDADLFRKLRPLLRRPIPAGFIEHVGEVTGKPYESTGVRSVQVQMDRLDNVLGPMNWGYKAEHSEDGKRCYVVAWVGESDGPTRPLVRRDSWGGVNRGSTEGNIWKGSFTNAAKLALARLGPGWEVYVGAADFDPDTDQAAAKAQEKNGEGSGEKKLAPDRAEKLQALLDEAGVEKKHLDAKLRQFGVKKLTDLQVSQGIQLYEWAVEQGTGGGS